MVSKTGSDVDNLSIANDVTKLAKRMLAPPFLISFLHGHIDLTFTCSLGHIVLRDK